MCLTYGILYSEVSPHLAINNHTSSITLNLQLLFNLVFWHMSSFDLLELFSVLYFYFRRWNMFFIFFQKPSSLESISYFSPFFVDLNYFSYNGLQLSLLLFTGIRSVRRGSFSHPLIYFCREGRNFTIKIQEYHSSTINLFA